MNVDELLEQYMNDPKWKGKLFMDDEKTCYIDGLLVGLGLTEQLKQQILSLENERYKTVAMNVLKIEC